MMTPGPNITADNHELSEMSYDKMMTLCTMKLLHLVRSGKLSIAFVAVSLIYKL